MKKNSHKKGFSLIELLVVIAIIAILTAIITSNFGQSKAKARDAKRVSDLAQIQLALELFFDRCNGYPLSITDTSQTIVSCPNGITLGTYISKVPTDTMYPYVYGVNDAINANPSTIGTDYILKAQLETNNSSALQDDVDANQTWVVYDGGYQLVTVDCSDSLTAYNYCVQPK